jgi:ankyrin repeat protein
MGGSNEIAEKEIPEEVYRAEYIDDTENIELNEINPYSILNISSNSSQGLCRSSYMKLATVPNRRKRAEACLAYDVLCHKNKYKKSGDIFKVKKKDCFYCTVVGDLNLLKKKIELNKNFLYQKDDLKRSLLYLSARNGYYNLTEYLINKGININDVQKCGSTALHGAAYYGQTLIVQLLIDHGIDTSIKNDYGHTAADEAKTPFIKELITDSHTDKIKNFYQDLLSKGLVSNIIPIKKKDKIICQKLIVSQNLLPENFSTIKFSKMA